MAFDPETIDITATPLWRDLRRGGLSSRRSLTALLPLIRLQSGCDAVGIRLVNDDGRLPFDTEIGFPPISRSITDDPSLHGHACLCIQLLHGVIQAGQPGMSPGGSFFAMNAETLHKAVKTYGDLPHLADHEWAVQSIILTPIRHQETPLGLIHCADPRPYRATDATVRQVEGMAADLARELAHDAMWPPAARYDSPCEEFNRAICPLCHCWRDGEGVWHQERRRRPRVSHWTVRSARQVVCPSCLPFHDTE